jgi:peptide/nickel transport system permease protein
MGKLLVRRFIFALIALLAILFLATLGLNMARGHPFGPSLGKSLRSSAEYVWMLLQGDWGISTSRHRDPVSVQEVIGATLGKSLLLLVTALLIAAAVGVLLGGMAARRRRSPWGLPILLSSLLGISMPSFLLALVLQVLAIRFYQKTGVRLVSMGGFKQSALWLPALVLAARPLAQITRITFFSISETLEEDYIRTALSKGVPKRSLFRRHVYRNVAIPVFTTVVTSLRFSLISLPVVEFFFSWPGAGEALLRGIRRQDDALVYGLTLCLGLLFILINVMLEGLYRLVDPRLRGVDPNGKREITQLRSGLWATLSELGYSLMDSTPIYWLRRLFSGRRERPTSAFSQLVHERAVERGGENLEGMHRRERRKAWFRAILLNPALLLGLLLLIPLLGVILFGTSLAPHNPYNTISLRFVDGQIQAPPFKPGAEFPWGTDVLGRDVFSLILAGAQQTLVITTIVMLARIAVGSLLGLLAGWFEGTWFDRLIGNCIEIIAAFPALLCAMVLILALGIRRGAISFVVALGFVGWGEVAQFVRAQVVSLKPRPFVEAAVVTGGRWPEILSRHILPNLLSPLVGLAALEMGAVLMLLGELGFVGIFIGGGAFAELVVFGPPYYYSDVPEWAAMLANIRSYARTYPWMAWPPALAFAVTILAFNLTGEGILRLIERVGASFTRLLNRYTALAAVAFVALMMIIRSQTGPIAFYKPLAAGFDGQRALDHVRLLASPELAGRRMGSTELEQAAEYIAAQFEAAGLQPAGQAGSYFQETEREFFALTATPLLARVHQDGSTSAPWAWPHDFNVALSLPYRVDGKKRSGEVVLVGLGPLPEVGSGRGYNFLRSLDLEDKIVITPDIATYDALRRQNTIAGALIIQQDEHSLQTMPLGNTRLQYYYVGGQYSQPKHPVLRIHRRVAEDLLEGSGKSLAALEKEIERLDSKSSLVHPTGKTVTLEVQGEVRREKAKNVLAYLPGGTGTGGAAYSEGPQKMDDQMIVLMAAYDGSGTGPEGILFPGAQEQAAGVASMIELAQLWQEIDYRPKRTFLFVAYVGQGVDRNQSYRQHPKPNEFLSAKRGFTSYKIWSVFELHRLGDAQGDRVLIDTPSVRLGKLLTQAARQVDARASQVESVLDLEAIQEGGGFSLMGEGVGEEYTWAEVSWGSADPHWGTPDDTADRVSSYALEQSGKTLSLALMVLGREWNY